VAIPAVSELHVSRVEFGIPMSSPRGPQGQLRYQARLEDIHALSGSRLHCDPRNGCQFIYFGGIDRAAEDSEYAKLTLYTESRLHASASDIVEIELDPNNSHQHPLF
jgi:hypothetical protein